ncbi:MAG: ATP-binding protein, partial [Elusimicrobia bacterium]|nr:ATP-binding protein [Elusimicrobiota bacterium]
QLKQARQDAAESAGQAARVPELEAQLKQARQAAAESAARAARVPELEAQLKQARQAVAESAARATRVPELEAQLKQARQAAAESAGQAARVPELETRLEQARREAAAAAAAVDGARIEALEKQLKQAGESAAALAARTAQIPALEGRLRDVWDKAQATVAALQAELGRAQARIEELSRPGAGPAAGQPLPDTTRTADFSGAAGGIPPLEPALEASWTKILEFMRGILETSYAHLRKLSAMSLSDAQRARLKLAAGTLAQGKDTIAALNSFLDEAAAPAVPGGLENALTAALAKWEPALRKRGIGIVRRFEAPPPRALFQAEGMQLVLYQLLRNAHESMPGGGSLTVRLWKDAATGAACLALGDTGCGFKREALDALPEAFVSGKPGHLGLGLALASRILGRWGASLEAANNEGAGATVTLRFAAGPPDAPLPSDGPSV